MDFVLDAVNHATFGKCHRLVEASKSRLLHVAGGFRGTMLMDIFYSTAIGANRGEDVEQVRAASTTCL